MARVKSILVSKWTPETEQSLDGTVLEIATDIHRRAVALAPVDTRNLVNSGKIVRNRTADYSIVFGSLRVRYARRRHYENKKNPQTLRYLERAGDSVARGNTRKYFR